VADARQVARMIQMTGIVEKTNAMLGLKAKDKVTGFKGVITSVCFDLYGCIQVAITPPAKSDADDLKNGHWFDINRIIASTDRVMDSPNFDAKGTTPQDYSHGPSVKPARAADGKR